MIRLKDIKSSFDEYSKVHPEESPGLSLLKDQLSKPRQNITSRKNFVGHVTASIFVVNENSRQVLLLEHKSLAKMLQPGGHIDQDDDTLTEAALRELEEETGMRAHDLKARQLVPFNSQVPFDIDTHYIPENPRKEEPGHYHHDFRFLFTTSGKAIMLNKDEANSYMWVDWEDFANMQSFQRVSEKINVILEPTARDFFRSIASGGEKISIIAVSHIIPSSQDYILALKENFNLVGIIPKPKSIEANTLKLLEENNITILHQFTRSGLTKSPAELLKILRGHENICLIDIGGYFAGCANKLKQKLGPKFLGIVEDTENGHKRYEASHKGEYAFMSVARSTLKNFEDQLVGHSIAHAAETILRQDNTLITYKKCGIIGYGKVGRGIGEYLRQRGIQTYVSELDPLRAVQASCDGSIILSTTDVVRSCEVIFCATGAQAIDILRFRDLRNGAYLASATSSDDELNLDFVSSEYTKSEIQKNIVEYSKRGHKFYMMNDGNAVNFLFSAAVDKYINLVQGELVYSVTKMHQAKEAKSHAQIETNSSKEHAHIANLWLHYIYRRH